jgi:hypothetical protein
MMGNAKGMFAIALYVPDGSIRELNQAEMCQRAILTGIPELDFVPPPWWEHSHTVRLGLAQTDEL